MSFRILGFAKVENSRSCRRSCTEAFVTHKGLEICVSCMAFSLCRTTTSSLIRILPLGFSAVASYQYGRSH